MKKYYRLTQSDDDTCRIVTKIELPNDPSGNLSTFRSGREIVVSVPNPLKLDVDGLSGGNPSHYIEGPRIVIISALFLMALKASGVDNFRVFPAILRDMETGRKWENYYAFNEVGCIDAVLLGECKYDVLFDHGENSDRPPLLDFDYVVFSEEKLKKDYNMFRLAHSPSRHLYVDDKVVEVLLERVPPEKWGITFEEVEIK